MTCILSNDDKGAASLGLSKIAVTILISPSIQKHLNQAAKRSHLQENPNFNLGKGPFLN